MSRSQSSKVSQVGGDAPSQFGRSPSEKTSRGVQPANTGLREPESQPSPATSASPSRVGDALNAFLNSGPRTTYRNEATGANPETASIANPTRTQPSRQPSFASANASGPYYQNPFYYYPPPALPFQPTSPFNALDSATPTRTSNAQTPSAQPIHSSSQASNDASRGYILPGPPQRRTPVRQSSQGFVAHDPFRPSSSGRKTDHAADELTFDDIDANAGSGNNVYTGDGSSSSRPGIFPSIYPYIPAAQWHSSPSPYVPSQAQNPTQNSGYSSTPYGQSQPPPPSSSGRPSQSATSQPYYDSKIPSATPLGQGYPTSVSSSMPTPHIPDGSSTSMPEYGGKPTQSNDSLPSLPSLPMQSGTFPSGPLGTHIPTGDRPPVLTPIMEQAEPLGTSSNHSSQYELPPVMYYGNPYSQPTYPPQTPYNGYPYLHDQNNSSGYNPVQTHDHDFGPLDDDTCCSNFGRIVGTCAAVLAWVFLWPFLLIRRLFRRRKAHSIEAAIGANQEGEGETESTADIMMKWTTKQIPKQVYHHLLLRLPSLYFSRVARIFEEANLGLPDLKKMALESASNSKSMHVFSFKLETPNVPPAYESLKHTWESFIDSVMREWKTFNIISVLLLSAILTILQIEAAASDPVTRYSALLSLICALMSLLYGCMYIIRFGTMRKPYKAAEWALEANKTTTVIWWNVWVLLAMPAVWLSWSLILYIVCIMSFVWRTTTDPTQGPESMSKAGTTAVRVLITVILGIGLLYGALIINTLKRYGGAMDRAWKERIDGWMAEKAVVQQQASVPPVIPSGIDNPYSQGSQPPPMSQSPPFGPPRSAGYDYERMSPFPYTDPTRSRDAEGPTLSEQQPPFIPPLDRVPSYSSLDFHRGGGGGRYGEKYASEGSETESGGQVSHDTPRVQLSNIAAHGSEPGSPDSIDSMESLYLPDSTVQAAVETGVPTRRHSPEGSSGTAGRASPLSGPPNDAIPRLVEPLGSTEGSDVATPRSSSLPALPLSSSSSSSNFGFTEVPPTPQKSLLSPPPPPPPSFLSSSRTSGVSVPDRSGLLPSLPSPSDAYLSSPTAAPFPAGSASTTQANLSGTESDAPSLVQSSRQRAPASAESSTNPFDAPADPNSYEELVGKATDESLTSANWDIILRLGERVSREKQKGARSLVSALIKRLEHRSAKVQLMALTVAATLSRNGEIELHRELASPAFVRALDKLVTGEKAKGEVQRRTLHLIAEWCAAFEGIPSLRNMKGLYDELRAKGYVFPPPSSPPLPPLPLPPPPPAPAPALAVDNEERDQISDRFHEPQTRDSNHRHQPHLHAKSLDKGKEVDYSGSGDGERAEHGQRPGRANDGWLPLPDEGDEGRSGVLGKRISVDSFDAKLDELFKNRK